MYSIERLEKKIDALPIDEVLPFSSINLDIPQDTLRKYLHRLHERGKISIVRRGHFKKVKPFKQLLFVYGSLKKGFDNHDLLSKSAKRLGKATTVGKFAMYEDSFGNYPFLVKQPISKIEGELYEIKRKELLDAIDEFEGAPEYYQRKKIRIKSHHGENVAFTYIREKIDIDKDQKPLNRWENDTDYKVKKLDKLLEAF
jgi:gamma-glutamylcyclotransferase (GGCT)/AIG2-like uncharacterized protein YtfP